MDSLDERLKDISEIRSMMEQSSKFLSLSGLSGIAAGTVGVAASLVAWNALGRGINEGSTGNVIPFLFIESIVTLVCALGSAAYFSRRMAKQKGVPFWTDGTKYLLVSLFTPLIAGGLFCLILLYHDIFLLIAPSMLLFYGLALLNSSKYTLKEIRYLGFSEIALGLISAMWTDYGLVCWCAGFGLLHIVYGAYMYFKYE
ncbi:MAG TPA: hypothetical protein VMM58_10185 [Bacteroidota bacterium]|nr:hypothetical protein [Bacteroidota bacterium]